MITLPKPKYAETAVPIGLSKDEYRDQIIDMQAHVLSDAFDRVSFQEFIYVMRPYLFFFKSPV